MQTLTQVPYNLMCKS